MPLIRCKKCVFYDEKRASFDCRAGDELRGACRRHPPNCFSAYMDDDGDSWASGYPHVEPDDGCGDGEEKS
jgi:hypothetical protein